MVDLTRTVRFFLNSPASGEPPPRHNGFAAWPPPRGLGRFYQLRVGCRGRVDPVTGYFINIKHIDEAVRAHAIKCFQEMLDESACDGFVPMGKLLGRLIKVLDPPLRHSVHTLQLDLSPHHSLSMRSRDMEHVLISQEFEFCAAHRLHAPQLSPQQNREVFGKCNNPSGHGHNYQLQVSVQAPVQSDGQVLQAEQIDVLVDQNVIQYLDHKHLNIDIPEFAKLNPSVEHISMVIYEILEHPISMLGVELEAVSVWETPKTMCTYRRPRQDTLAPEPRS